MMPAGAPALPSVSSITMATLSMLAMLSCIWPDSSSLIEQVVKQVEQTAAAVVHMREIFKQFGR